MKHILLAFFSFFFLQITAQKPVDINLKVDVVYLASDYLEGRETGKKGEQLAAEYIVARFQEIGLQPKGSNGSWYQSFDFVFKPNPHESYSENRSGKNVLGYLDNGAATTVAVCAHYDHLGYGAFGSRHTGEPAIHNGADDNASGVAAMLYIAEQLQAGIAKNNNYLFLAFSGEELGLYGSKHFVVNPTIDLPQINYLLNMDMVGRLNNEKIVSVNGAGTSPLWKEVIPELNTAGIQPKLSESGIGPSDHTNFYLKDIPVLHFFTGQHQDYHKPIDDAHLINYAGLQDVSDFLVALIEKLDSKGKLPFTKTKDDSNTKSRKAADFKVTLGVMPDYVFDGTGMRIEAVIDGRPAASAGLQNGDVVIQLGDMKVGDIYGYMEALGKFKKGDKAKVVVMRGEKKVKAEVMF